MIADDLRFIARAHGALAWASVVATAAAAWLISRRTPGARSLPLKAASLASGALAIAAAVGLVLHEPYQRGIRQRVFTQSPRIGWLFERKEHFAFGAVALALSALAALCALELRDRRRALQPDQITSYLRAAAVRAYATSAVLAAIAAVISSVVARFYPF